jgi:nucleotide-binding universal stress UspA family protein
MRSILVAVGGSETDLPLFETALAAARPVSGHLQFVHVHIGAGEAAVNVPHTAFAIGPALSNALKDLDAAARTRLATAAQHFYDFCRQSKIEICDAPAPTKGVTASWHEEEGRALKRLLLRARHNDLVVVGRARRANGLPTDFMEELLIGSGRPILIASSTLRPTLTGTIMVCWKETAEAARAVSAAMPFLTQAERVVVVSVAENEDLTEAVSDVARQLAWNGVRAETRIIVPNGAAIPEVLASAGQEYNADLVVLGAYGRSRMREILFGSCTHALIRTADRPLLLMH